MTPLAPLYLLGALAIAGPILFHLWRRTPRGRREFSTLMFLTPAPPRVTSRSRVEHWLLLVLRGAVLLLLALAFARPLWRATSSEPEKGGDEELVAVLVDTSASLRRDGAWPELMKLASEGISKLPSTATVGLFAFDDRWRSVADFTEMKSLEPSARRDLVVARLRELKPTWGGTNLGEALVRTASALQEVQTERATPAKLRIILASDLPVGANLDALRGFEWPSDLRVEPLIARSSSPSNAGLQLVERNLDLGDDELRVRVTNSADSKLESFVIQWEGHEATKTSIYVPPGQSRVVVPPKRPEAAASSAFVLTGDDHDFDNRVFVAPPHRETKLVVYCGTDKPDDPDGLRFYLEGVFSASKRYQIETRGWHDAASVASSERPSLVVLVEPVAEAESFVTQYIESGGTVLIAARSPSFGTESLRQCGLRDVTLTEASVKRDAMLAEIDFEHSLFAPFAESQFSDFTGIRFWKHRTLSGLGRAGEEGQSQHVQDDGKPLSSNRPRVLCRFDDGSPAFVQYSVGKGRVWLLTSGWHPADSQLARSSKFPPLMFRILEQSSGMATRPESVVVGSSIRWTQADNSNSRCSVKRPDGSLVQDLPSDEDFSATDQPGLYGLELSGRSETIAVNLSADESRTAPLSIDQLESLGLRLGTAERPQDVARTKDRERQLQLAELEQNQKLWRWGLVAVIGLLLLETWIAGRLPTE